jgi:lipoprotein-anchoring transpeptidase ErfK/SrfK
MALLASTAQAASVPPSSAHRFPLFTDSARTNSALFPSAPVTGAGAARTVVRITDQAPLYAAPGGPLLVVDDEHVYEQGSAWVVLRYGAWLGISTVSRRNGALGWIRKTPARRLTTTRLLAEVDLSERRVRVTRGAEHLMSAPVAIGAPRSPSPMVPTSVAKRIAVTPNSAYSGRGYGPMIVALRLWQPFPSHERPFGGIMAFHGTDNPRSIGTASSGGCFRMSNADVVRLSRFIGAGTPVIIRS